MKYIRPTCCNLPMRLIFTLGSGSNIAKYVHQCDRCGAVDEVMDIEAGRPAYLGSRKSITVMIPSREPEPEVDYEKLGTCQEIADTLVDLVMQVPVNSHRIESTKQRLTELLMKL